MIDITMDGEALFWSVEPTILDEVKVTMMGGEEYTLPAVAYPYEDPQTALFAAVIKLHLRVQELEKQLGENRENLHD
jgi:hypothetical protein